MRLTTKGRFAVTAMIDLGMRHQRGPVTLAGISDRQRISLSYLEQLFGRLRRQGIVDSVRGCMTHDLWMSLNARIYDYLDSVHLAELVQQQLDKPEQCAGKKHEHRRVVGSADLKVAANG